MNEAMERFKSLLEDEATAKAIVAKDTLEDVQAFLKTKGVDFTPDQITNALKTILKPDKGELDEGSLESVAGGKKVSFWIFDFDFQKPKWWPW